ncbi:MAG: hypothetical protein CME13_16795 [Gemmatimonadetes bacterium]|jgi:hypothetical protein|nr:hypothetical protein [Gemmatimonadota bacterium]HCV24448.1 hypothetical protein [Candidatus Latescibacterota bacterium]|tara:strand:+ start:2204 stop:2434 length:231 start_codon:yes stop_codon:yes gene_type:complete
MTTLIRVMLVDDHPIVRDGLRAMLTTEEAMNVIGEATDRAGAIELAPTSARCRGYVHWPSQYQQSGSNPSASSRSR